MVNMSDQPTEESGFMPLPALGDAQSVRCRDVGPPR